MNYRSQQWHMQSLPARCVTLMAMLLVMLCSGTYAAANDRSVTIDVTHEKMENVLNAIAGQTGYQFFYSTDMLDGCKPVTFKAVKKPLDNVLDHLLPPQRIIL